MGIGFGILAGAAGAFPAIQAGIDGAKKRDDLDTERAYVKKRRGEEDTDRAFTLQQRERALAEQRRRDRMNAELAGEPAPEAAAPAQPAAPASPAAPPASAAPASPGLTPAPAAAPAGLGMQPPTAQAGQPAAPAAGKLPAPDWKRFSERADIYRRGQEFEKADAFDALAKKARFANSARRIPELRGAAVSMSLEQLAKQAAAVFDDDGLPGRVKKIEPQLDGSISVTILDEESGRESVTPLKSKEALLSLLEGYYSPETYAAYIKAEQDSARKTREKLNEPAVLNPGQIRVAGPNGTKIGEGNPLVPKGYELTGYDPQGQPQYKKADPKKAEDPFKAAIDAWENVAKYSGFKEQATPVQVAMSQRLTRQFVKESGFKLDPAHAAEVAMDATLNPDKLFPRYDAETGEVVLSYKMPSGGHVIAERLGSPKSPRNVKPEQMRKVAQDFLDSPIVGDSRELFIAAASSPDGKRRLHEEVSRRMSTPEGVAMVTTKLGRQAEESDVERAIDQAIKALSAPLSLLESHLDPKIKEAQAKMEKKRSSDAKAAETQKGATESATKLLADPSEEATRALYELQGSPEFSTLDRATKEAVFTRVNGRQAVPRGGLYGVPR